MVASLEPTHSLYVAGWEITYHSDITLRRSQYDTQGLTRGGAYEITLVVGVYEFEVIPHSIVYEGGDTYFQFYDCEIEVINGKYGTKEVIRNAVMYRG